jgi:hypothetical protein
MGSEAIRTSPCGPDPLFHGYKPTCWREWPAEWAMWQQSQCYDNQVVVEPTPAESLPPVESVQSTSWNNVPVRESQTNTGTSARAPLGMPSNHSAESWAAPPQNTVRSESDHFAPVVGQPASGGVDPDASFRLWQGESSELTSDAQGYRRANFRSPRPSKLRR